MRRREGCQEAAGAGGLTGVVLVSSPSQHSWAWSDTAQVRPGGQQDRDQACPHLETAWASLQHRSSAVAWNKRTGPSFLIWMQITVKGYQDRPGAQTQKPLGRGGAGRALAGRTCTVPYCSCSRDWVVKVQTCLHLLRPVSSCLCKKIWCACLFADIVHISKVWLWF